MDVIVETSVRGEQRLPLVGVPGTRLFEGLYSTITFSTDNYQDIYQLPPHKHYQFFWLSILDREDYLLLCPTCNAIYAKKHSVI